MFFCGFFYWIKVILNTVPELQMVLNVPGTESSLEVVDHPAAPEALAGSSLVLCMVRHACGEFTQVARPGSFFLHWEL